MISKYQSHPLYLLFFSLLFVTSCTSTRLNIPSDVEELARINGAPVFLGPINLSLPNSAGGRQLTYIWKNIGSKDIKYLSITPTLYNRVDDVVRCRYRFNGGVRFTGPTKPGSYERGSPRTLCYDSTAIRAEIRSITVVFMDDTTVTIRRERLLEMGALHPDA